MNLEVWITVALLWGHRWTPSEHSSHFGVRTPQVYHWLSVSLESTPPTHTHTPIHCVGWVSLPPVPKNWNPEFLTFLVGSPWIEANLIYKHASPGNVLAAFFCLLSHRRASGPELGSPHLQLSTADQMVQSSFCLGTRIPSFLSATW